MPTTPKTSRARRRVGVLAAAALAVAAFAAPGAAHAASCPGADVPLNGPHLTVGQQRLASDALICVANEARAIRGLSQLTVDQSLSDFARNKSDTITRGYNNVACGGFAENVLPFSACVESVEVLVPAPTPRQLIDGILTGNGNAIETPDVTTIGAGVSNGNPNDGPTGAGVTADVLTITPTNAGNNSGANPPANGDCAEADTPITQANLSAAEDAITCLVNKERSKAGVAPLTVNATLHGTATAHSQDMLNRAFFGHTNPDGQSFCDRIVAAGYPATCNGTGDNTTCSYCRENIAYRGAGATPNDLMYDPQDGWMTHPPDANGNQFHRDAILDANEKVIGIGLVIGDPDGGDGVTATQDFGG